SETSPFGPDGPPIADEAGAVVVEPPHHWHSHYYLKVVVVEVVQVRLKKWMGTLPWRVAVALKTPRRLTWRMMDSSLTLARIRMKTVVVVVVAVVVVAKI